MTDAPVGVLLAGRSSRGVAMTKRVRFAILATLTCVLFLALAAPAFATQHWFGSVVLPPVSGDWGSRFTPASQGGISFADDTHGWAVRGQNIYATTDGVSWKQQFNYRSIADYANVFVGVRAFDASSCVVLVESD